MPDVCSAQENFFSRFERAKTAAETFDICRQRVTAQIEDDSSSQDLWWLFLPAVILLLLGLQKRHSLKRFIESLFAVFRQGTTASRLNKDCLNVAVCGAVKSGKTRLIQALKGIDNSAHAQRRTIVSDRYISTIAVDRKVVFHELAGTGRFGGPSADDYFRMYRLADYDKILLLTGETLREEELRIGKQAVKTGKRCAFVRSRCDRDLKQNADDLGTPINEEIRSFFLRSAHDSFRKEKWRYNLLDSEIPSFAVSALLLENYYGGRSSKSTLLDENALVNFIFDT